MKRQFLVGMHLAAFITMLLPWLGSGLLIQHAVAAEAGSGELAREAGEGFTTVEWIDLMPQDDLDALLNPPDYITNVEDGSFEDQIVSQLDNFATGNAEDRYQQALISTRVIAEMNNRPIRIPGFIVPLEFDDEQNTTQFFLVPFFGACIHVPPPPPNQIIFVEYPRGLKLEALYDPYWISGVLKTTIVENDMATSAYSMEMEAFERYTE